MERQITVQEELDALRGARVLLDDRDRWVKRAWESDDGETCAYCLVGAIVHSYNPDCMNGLDPDSDEEDQTLLDNLTRSLPVPLFNPDAGPLWEHATLFNDRSTTDHAAVLQLLDAAIAKLEAHMLVTNEMPGTRDAQA